MRTPLALLVLVLAIAGCSAGSGDAYSGGDGPASGNPPPPVGDCDAIGLSFSPLDPIAGPTATVNVIAMVTAAPLPSLSWRVRFNGVAIEPMALRTDNTEIAFPTVEPGVYSVTVVPTGSSVSCVSVNRSVNVGVAGGKPSTIRLRVVPRQTTPVPPFETRTVIVGGATMDVGVIRPADSSTFEQLRLEGPAGGGAGYLRFAPNAAPGAVVEAFADSAGQLAVPLAVQLHSVLVIPSATGLAPRRITDWMPASGQPITVAAGSPVTGSVRDPDGAPLTGAVVRLSIDGVPSTVATTDSGGGFALRATLGGGAVTVEVTPATASSLPRLSATSQAFDLGVPLDIRYTVRLKDLAGLRVKRASAALGAATVMVVGSAQVATVTAGTTVTATGNVRIAATANASGVLPSLRVPPATLSAVITTATGELAVTSLDTTGDVPATLDAPPMQTVATSVLGATGTDALPSAVIDLVPRGALETAGAPELHVTATAAGAISVALAAGGRYDLRLPPVPGRGAQLLVADRDAASIAPSYRLPAPLELRGAAQGAQGQPVANASVQLLCVVCTGLDRERPIAETSTDGAGRFVLSVPDPGTM